MKSEAQLLGGSHQPVGLQRSQLRLDTAGAVRPPADCNLHTHVGLPGNPRPPRIAARARSRGCGRLPCSSKLPQADGNRLLSAASRLGPNCGFTSPSKCASESGTRLGLSHRPFQRDPVTPASVDSCAPSRLQERCSNERIPRSDTRRECVRLTYPPSAGARARACGGH